MQNSTVSKLSPLFCLALTAIIALALSSCSSSSLDSYESLGDQGILALSTTNPYLGTNLYLAQQAEKSGYLFNFLKGRGAPTAIELTEGRFGPERMIMYYPGQKEVYVADVHETPSARQWIVRGPFTIERQDYKALAELDIALNGEPVFMIQGKQYRFRFHQEKPVEHVLSPKVPPTPIPTPKPKKKLEPKVVKPEEMVPTDFSKMNSDQMALYVSKGFAERSANGDLIHTVKFENETLENIVKWYTGTNANVPEVAIQNGLTIESPVTKGQRLRIPGNLVKEPKQMPGH